MTDQETILKNPNVFQPDKGFSAVQQGGANISIHCPHCRQLGSFHPALKSKGQYQKFAKEIPSGVVSMNAAVLMCPSIECGGLVFAIYDDSQKIWELEPPQLIDFNPSELPPAMLKTLSEAVSCHAAGAYRATAMMVRRLLEEICEANGAKGKTLHQRLEELKSKVTLPIELFDAAIELKALGNDAAHITGTSFDDIGADEAQDSIELAKEILKSLYQLKNLVARLQARRKIP